MTGDSKETGKQGVGSRGRYGRKGKFITQSPVPSDALSLSKCPQSPVPSPQSPVTSHQSPVPSDALSLSKCPQSPVT
ncbi:MAG: hypothetical protein ACKPBC_21605 [Sphaerospermopsis kisseleviana]